MNHSPGANGTSSAPRADLLPDLRVLGRAGLAIAVVNAAPEVKRAAHYVTARAGGERAVREVVESLVKAQGKWEETIRLARLRLERAMGIEPTSAAWEAAVNSRGRRSGFSEVFPGGSGP